MKKIMMALINTWNLREKVGYLPTLEKGIFKSLRILSHYYKRTINVPNDSSSVAEPGFVIAGSGSSGSKN